MVIVLYIIINNYHRYNFYYGTTMKDLTKIVSIDTEPIK